MSTEFLFNRGALRRARTAWDEKRERNGEKAAKLSAELRELCICASPALQNLAANAGVVVEQLKLNRTPIYGLRRYRGVGHKRQIGPESLQWRDLDIDWESHSGKAFQETICNEWLALIRDPQPGDVCWVANTAKGRACAESMIARRNSEQGP